MHFTVLNSAEKKKRRFGTTRLNMSPAGTVPDPDGTRARAGSWWPKRTPSVGWAVGISLSVHVFFSCVLVHAMPTSILLLYW